MTDRKPGWWFGKVCDPGGSHVCAYGWLVSGWYAMRGCREDGMESRLQFYGIVWGYRTFGLNILTLYKPEDRDEL